MMNLKNFSKNLFFKVIYSFVLLLFSLSVCSLTTKILILLGLHGAIIWMSVLIITILLDVLFVWITKSVVLIQERETNK